MNLLLHITFDILKLVRLGQNKINMSENEHLMI